MSIVLHGKCCEIMLEIGLPSNGVGLKYGINVTQSVFLGIDDEFIGNGSRHIRNICGGEFQILISLSSIFP